MTRLQPKEARALSKKWRRAVDVIRADLHVK
jgi:hypothetical protein